MSKAFDHTEWIFICRMMQSIGFVGSWINKIMMCISFVSYMIIHEGKEMRPITRIWGLRQGYPLSAYLFIIGSRGLSSLLQYKERMQLLHGCKIACGTPPVSHLFFANDNLIFLKANTAECDQLKEWLRLYELSSPKNTTISPS